jgi:uncharacterized iron-regulated membrane protein
MERNPGHLTLRRRFRAFWLKVHLFIALAAGFVFVVLGLTGSVNVFFRELEELGLPTQTHHESDVQPHSLDEIMQTLTAAHPQRKGQWILVLPGYGKTYLWAIYPNPEETMDEFYAPLRVLVDVYSGEILKESFWGQTLSTLIYEIHASFLLGKLGSKPGKLGFDIVCFSGLLLLLSALSGLYLWWPRWNKMKTAITFKRRASPERFYFDLHKVTGFYAATVLVTLAFTGFSFSYDDYLKPLIRCFSPIGAEHLKDPELKSESAAGGRRISIADAVAIADSVFPGAELRGVQTPDGPDGVYVIEKRQSGEANRLRPRTKIWIDQYTGKVLAVQDPNQFTAGETFLNLMWPLHSGEAIGLPGRIAWCVIGFTPLILYVSGIVRWLQKRKAARRSEAGFKKRLERTMG